MSETSTRTASIERNTAETQIKLSVDLDGTGVSTISTGVPFFDHMLTLFSKHSRIDLQVETVGDIEVDFHHTVEDTGIVLGKAVAEALGDKRGIYRYGSAMLPMDETLARVVVDYSGRPFIDYRGVSETVANIGGTFPLTLVEEFMRAYAFNAQLNLHIELLYGRDGHHISEAIFKGLARASDEAFRIDERIAGVVPSTKNTLNS